jgi:hypothetical protein
VLPSLLVLRPGVDGVILEVELVRGFAAGSMLLRRLFITLGGRLARRAAGLCSSAVSSSSSASAIEAWRLAAGVEERGVDRIGRLPLAGVAGDCIGLAAKGRLDCCEGVVDVGRAGEGGEGTIERRLACCEGVVDAGRVTGGGERAERLNGLRTVLFNVLPRLDWVLNEEGDLSVPLRYGEGVVRVNGLKLCPTTVSRMLTLEFQRGLTAGRSVLGECDGVGVSTMEREGAVP